MHQGNLTRGQIGQLLQPGAPAHPHAHSSQPPKAKVPFSHHPETPDSKSPRERQNRQDPQMQEKKPSSHACYNKG